MRTGSRPDPARHVGALAGATAAGGLADPLAVAGDALRPWPYHNHRRRIMAWPGPDRRWRPRPGPPLLIIGFGISFPWGLMDELAVSVVPKERAGMAAGIFATVRVGGEDVALALATALLSGLAQARVSPLIARPEASSSIAERLATGTLEAPRRSRLRSRRLRCLQVTVTRSGRSRCVSPASPSSRRWSCSSRCGQRHERLRPGANSAVQASRSV